MATDIKQLSFCYRMSADHTGHYVMIVAPLGQDASAMAALLNAEEIQTCTCSSLSECAARTTDATLALILTEEALVRDEVPSVLEVLRDQPHWSELPLIVLASGGEERRVTLLELIAAVPG